jgi:predicted enzyme related to lactoylglutathione lyase
MAHFSRVAAVVIDVAADDHDRELSFWEAATGQSLDQLEYPEYHGGRLPGQDIGLLVQRLGEGAARVHVDIHTDDLDAELKRLEQHGAQRVQRADKWWVMRDPAGLLFCVVPDPGGTLNDNNARRWD